MILNPDGTTADANQAALELLGVSLEQLRDLPPGAFSARRDPDERAAFRREWEREGEPDLSGEATLRRLDGSELRVRFGVTPLEEGRYLAILEPITGNTDDPPAIYTAGQVLAHWRAAERRLAEVPEGSAEWRSVNHEIERFRKRYHELFER